MVIVIPTGEIEYATRNSSFYNSTFNYLKKALGLQEIN